VRSGTKEWPSQLSVSGVCSSKDALQMHYKSALVLHFSVQKIIPPTTPGQPPPYNHFLNQLVSKSWVRHHPPPVIVNIH
jgi:hypothetical protein